MEETSELVEYILEIDYLTTKEFCDKFKVPHPTLINGVESFLQIDAVKHRMFVDKAKQLYKNRVTLDFIHAALQHSEIKNYEYSRPDGYTPPFNNYKFNKFSIQFRIFAGAIDCGVQTNTYGTEVSIPLCETCNSYLAGNLRFIFKQLYDKYYSC